MKDIEIHYVASCAGNFISNILSTSASCMGDEFIQTLDKTYTKATKSTWKENYDREKKWSKFDMEERIQTICGTMPFQHYKDIAEKKNIILITVESAQSDRLLWWRASYIENSFTLSPKLRLQYHHELGNYLLANNIRHYRFEFENIFKKSSLVKVINDITDFCSLEPVKESTIEYLQKKWFQTNIEFAKTHMKKSLTQEHNPNTIKE